MLGHADFFHIQTHTQHTHLLCASLQDTFSQQASNQVKESSLEGTDIGDQKFVFAHCLQGKKIVCAFL